MFYIITKKNCEMCKKALNYLNSKKIIYKEIQVDSTMIPPELMRAMESILIDEDTQSFASLKSFIRYKAPFFKEKNIEPILLSKDDIRKIITSNPKEVLSFPIILMLGENGITNYVVGFSSVVLDRWIDEPWTKGNFFNINRAYGDFYCCHECFEKEEKLLNDKNNYSTQNIIENKKSNIPENYFKSQIEKWKKTNSENFNNQKEANKLFYDNSIEKRRNSFQKERERLFKVGDRMTSPQSTNLNNENYIKRDFFNDSNKLNRDEFESKAKENYYQTNQNQVYNDKLNIQKNSNQYKSAPREPIYISENIIYAHNKNKMAINNNKPRIYGEKPIVNRDKIIDGLKTSSNFDPPIRDFPKSNNLNNSPVALNNQDLDNKPLKDASIILRRIGLGEEIGQPEFSVFNQKIIVNTRTEKEKIKTPSSNINDFLSEIKVILGNSKSEKNSTLDKKLVDYGTLNYAKSPSFSYVNEFEQEHNKKTESNFNTLYNANDSDEPYFEDNNYYPFKKSIINSLKDDNFVFDSEIEKQPDIIVEQIILGEQVRSNKPKLFSDKKDSFKVKNSEVILKWDDYQNDLKKIKKNPLIENIDIDEKKYISPFEKTKDSKKPKKNDSIINKKLPEKYEILEEEIYITNRKLLEFNEINYEIFSSSKNSDSDIMRNSSFNDFKKGNNK